ncbi:hypothetical protein DBT_2008 [Dissulfuribacter thermophilus]|uniref:Uncharacterized protein n=1 Tax=Dissulfuribacter thermophilus TaxID=1156395 RepID=A0A1B9F4B0_9BACT|nr:hypothetical protein DBT_2008 [Dissulfuribacter thermophilus]
MQITLIRQKEERRRKKQALSVQKPEALPSSFNSKVPKLFSFNSKLITQNSTLLKCSKLNTFKKLLPSTFYLFLFSSTRVTNSVVMIV